MPYACYCNDQWDKDFDLGLELAVSGKECGFPGRRPERVIFRKGFHLACHGTEGRDINIGLGEQDPGDLLRKCPASLQS